MTMTQDHDGDSLSIVREPKELAPRIHRSMQPLVHTIDYKEDVDHGLGLIKSQEIIFHKSLQSDD